MHYLDRDHLKRHQCCLSSFSEDPRLIGKGSTAASVLVHLLDIDFEVLEKASANEPLASIFSRMECVSYKGCFEGRRKVAAGSHQPFHKSFKNEHRATLAP